MWDYHLSTRYTTNVVIYAMIHVKLRFRRIKVSCCSSYLFVCDRRKEERKPLQSLNLNISLWITVKIIFMERHNSSGVTDPKTWSHLHLHPSAPSDHEHQRCETEREITLMLNNSCLEISFNNILKSYTSTLNVRLFSYLSSTISLFAIISTFIQRLQWGYGLFHETHS